MKKTLAIVLALVMALCMIPAVNAATTISGNSYDLAVYDWDNENEELGDLLGSTDDGNTVTAEYDYSALDEDTTGKFTDGEYMAIVVVNGWSLKNYTGLTDWTLTVDGKEIDVDTAAYAKYGTYYADSDNAFFPIQLTKAGYIDTFVVELTAEDADGNAYAETAKITVKVVNEEEDKADKTATITGISSQDDTVSAYIVGSKIYLDMYSDPAEDVVVDLTFANENGKAFSEITYLTGVSSDSSNVALYTGDEEYSAAYGIKLDGSEASVYFNGEADTDLSFTLETKSAEYTTKEYDVVVRTGVEEEDPKGIYFAESAKTIAIGQKYVPTVMGVATGKPVDATLYAGANTSYEVIDVDDDTVIGTREGVAYIYASYTLKSDATKTYNASSMKIVVTGSAVEETVPPVAGSVYKVAATTLNVRSGPGTGYGKLNVLYYGETVEVESIANGWAKLAGGGYVSAGYLRAVTNSDEASTMYVTCRTLNVRTGAGTSYAKVGTLSRNTAVEVVNVAGGWAELSNGTYVCYKYLAA